VDKQLGCAALLKAMMVLDPSIKPIRETALIVGEPPPHPVEASLTGVKWIQNSLNVVLDLSPPLVVDGNYGANTRAAVREFQSAHGLAVDGQAGDRTLAALDAALLMMDPTKPSAKLMGVVPAKKSWWRRLLGM